MQITIGSVEEVQVVKIPFRGFTIVLIFDEGETGRIAVYQDSTDITQNVAKYGCSCENGVIPATTENLFSAKSYLSAMPREAEVA